MTISTIQLKRGTAAEWTSANPVLALGELGLERDGNRIKFGDGATPWKLLPYYQDAGAVAKTAFTTKGDLLVGTGSAGVTRLPVPTAAGLALVSDPTASGGLAYDTVVGSVAGRTGDITLTYNDVSNAQKQIPRYADTAAAQAGLLAGEFADGDLILVLAP